MKTKNEEMELQRILEHQQLRLKNFVKLDLKHIEVLSFDVIKRNFNNFAKCESEWELLNVDDPIECLKGRFKIMRDIIEATHPHEYCPYYDEEVFINNLLLGKTIEDMFNVYRIRTDLDKCPLCGSSLYGMKYALSRRDNITHICSECGEKEAYEDMLDIRI